jgi:hypothetical protein
VLEEPRIGPSPFPKPRPRRPGVLPPFACLVRSAAASQAARGPQTTPPWAHTRESPTPCWRHPPPHRSSMWQTVLWRELGPRSAILPSAGLASRRSSDRRQPADHGLREAVVTWPSTYRPGARDRGSSRRRTEAGRCREQRLAASSAWPRACSRPSRLGSTCRTSIDQSRLPRQRGARRH